MLAVVPCRHDGLEGSSMFVCALDWDLHVLWVFQIEYQSMESPCR